jgi:hypothetical protein
MIVLGFMFGIVRGFSRDPRYVTLTMYEVSELRRITIPLNRRRVVLYSVRTHSWSPTSGLIGKSGMEDVLASCSAASSNI